MVIAKFVIYHPLKRLLTILVTLTLVGQAHAQVQDSLKTVEQAEPPQAQPEQDQPRRGRAKDKQQEDEQPTFPLDNIYAERKPWARSILKDFHFSLSTGMGHTFFNHELSGFGVRQPKGLDTKIFPMANQDTTFSNWLNQVVVDPTAAQSDDILKTPTDGKLGFKGGAFNIPLKGSIHYEFLGRYRLGAGYSYELMVIGPMRPISFQDELSGFQPTQNSGFMRKYFGMIGFSFYRLQSFLFTGDINVGGFNPGKNFTTSLIQKGVFVNGGVTIEKELSENLQLFARPSFEFKNYTMSVPYSYGGSIVHNFNAFYVNVGLTYSLPALPKCYHPNCQAQLNHAHGDREYRSRMHKFYKKQNPMYGENYPKLFKYKGQNKKKLNPY